MHEPPLILSIEDETTTRRALVAYLTDSGYAMIEAGNGRAGLERIFAQEPDVILCDLRMPELDGMGVLEELNKRGMEIPFIVVSGSGEMIDVRIPTIPPPQSEGRRHSIPSEGATPIRRKAPVDSGDNPEAIDCLGARSRSEATRDLQLFYLL